MTPQTAHLLREALRLSEEERGELAARLIDSLEPADDEGVEAAWGTEIEQRIEELETGQVQPISWPDARRMILDNTDDSAAG
jgi:putative addiction module component (TIGR02574 family)